MPATPLQGQERLGSHSERTKWAKVALRAPFAAQARPRSNYSGYPRTVPLAHRRNAVRVELRIRSSPCRPVLPEPRPNPLSDSQKASAPTTVTEAERLPRASTTVRGEHYPQMHQSHRNGIDMPQSNSTSASPCIRIRRRRRSNCFPSVGRAIRLYGHGPRCRLALGN